MPYPVPLEKRHAQTMQSLQQRVARLEARTASIDSGFPLAALPAVIDSGYSSGDPKAYVNGSTTLTGPYQHLAAYTPAAGDSVVVLPVGGSSQSYIILGKLT
ncbi:hypothetical protein EDD90_2752 [Streptomyces sp. Ag109_O5-1]|uniref:hypothetical protein n=1 Tax=Streptomyces sp. Ag109_O5-1 TaxID=1938851 RepID=UPI000F4F59A8|nr:hypothetical protein [Streptomyces sp. Ag109_O5-1]RPE39735.1 hypothetical protein EDD90_2752 [Streptomyces sp. Ag109_O5-1]